MEAAQAIKQYRMSLTPWNLIRVRLAEEHDPYVIEDALEHAKRQEALQLDHDATLTTGIAASIRRDLEAVDALQEGGTVRGKELLDLIKLRAALRKELVDVYMPTPKYTGEDAAGAAFADLAADYGEA
jgi:hypothetical protein